MTRGVLIYAHNNSEIDYLKIACANALMIKKNLKVPVTLVSDDDTINWGRQSLGEEFLTTCFEKIIKVERNYNFKNTRNFNDTSLTTKSLQFYNCNHYEAYDISPYDETLFIDADYLIMSSQLNNCWGSINDVMINHKIVSPLSEPKIYSKTVDDMGVRLYWATVIYFKKTELAQHLFSIVKHVQENFAYYKDLYCFSQGMFRNDYAFSIAVHMLNGFNDNGEVIKELPLPGLFMSWDTNDIMAINDINDITIFTDKTGERGNYILTRLQNTDVHIMNKWSINRWANKLIELYKEDV